MAKLKELGSNLDLVNTKAIQLPLDSLPSNAEHIMGELQKPITVPFLYARYKKHSQMKVEDIVKDLKDYEHDFPREHFCPPRGRGKIEERMISEQDMNMVFAEV